MCLRRGIFIDACTDIGRIDNVQFHGHWWWAASVGGNSEVVNKYMIDHLEAFIFGRTDWEYVNNTFVFPVKIGYHFIATKEGACNGQFSGIGADYSQSCVVVDAIQPMGLLITNGQFVAFAGDNPDRGRDFTELRWLGSIRQLRVLGAVRSERSVARQELSLA